MIVGDWDDAFLLVDASATTNTFSIGTMPLLGLVRKFREEFVAAAEAGGLPAGTRHDNPTRALVEGKAA